MAPAPRLVAASGEKFRRLARASQFDNPVVNLPWAPPVAWAISTAYIRGQVVAANGNWYVCVTNGTSAGSGSGPSTTGAAALITDNTVAWSWLGPAEISTADPQAPTRTTETSGPSGLSNYFYPGTNPEFFRACGCLPTVISTTAWRLDNLISKLGTTDNGRGASVEFNTDALKFGIAVGTGSSTTIRVVIDNRYYTISGTPQNGSTTWYVFDFSSVGRRRRRRVRVESPQGSFNFLGVAVSSNDQLYKPASPDNVRAAFIMESLGEGSAYGPWLPGGTVPNRVAWQLGWSDAWNLSKGGTGWINTGASSFYTYVERIAQAVSLSPDIIVFGTPVNDLRSSSSAITAAVVAGIAAVRAVSNCPIVVPGCWSHDPSVVTGTTDLTYAACLAAEDAVAAGVLAAGDSRTFHIPICRDSLPWITGAYNNSGFTTSANKVAYISADAIHPVDVGTAYYSDRLADAIRTRVLSVL